MTSQARPALFTVGRNPQDDSKLPFLLRLPLDGGLVLKARDVWPTTARVYCHVYEEEWSDAIEIVEETPVLLCRRRGGAIDLLLDRPRFARSQFVFTRVKGREAIFWQTQKTARAANPGGRIPRRRILTGPVTITVDTRERYPYKFTHQGAETVRATVVAGDYANHGPDGSIVAAVERKTLENLAGTLSDGTLAFQMQRLSELPLAAVVIEARYSALFKLEHVDGAWLADQLARLHVRYPTFTSSTPTPAATRKIRPTASSPLPSQTPPTRTSKLADRRSSALRPRIGISAPSGRGYGEPGDYEQGSEYDCAHCQGGGDVEHAPVPDGRVERDACRDAEDSGSGFSRASHSCAGQSAFGSNAAPASPTIAAIASSTRAGTDGSSIRASNLVGS